MAQLESPHQKKDEHGQLFIQPQADDQVKQQHDIAYYYLPHEERSVFVHYILRQQRPLILLDLHEDTVSPLLRQKITIIDLYLLQE